MIDRNRKALLTDGGRITGLVYLLYFAAAIGGGLLTKGFVVSGDASLTRRNILAHEALFQAGFAVSLLGTACYVVLTGLLYRWFERVDRTICLIAVFFSLMGCAIQAFGSLFQLGSLGSQGPQPISDPETLRVLAPLLLHVRTQAVNIGLVFFGFFDVLIGYLIFRSGFCPEFLGC